MNMQQRFGVLALAAVLVSGTALAQKAQISDAQVEANVLKALAADASLTNQPIQSSTAFGVVTLTGAVQTDAARDRAEQIASRTEGVRKVVDQLSVGSQAVASASTTNPAATASGNAGSNGNVDDDPASRNVLPGDAVPTGNGDQQPMAQTDPRATAVNQQGAYNQQASQYPLPGQGDGPIGSQPYPQAGGSQGGQYSQNGQYPQQGTYPAQSGYPQNGQYSQNGQYPQQGTYPSQGGGYPQNSHYPQANYPPTGDPQNGYPQAGPPNGGYGQPAPRIYRRDYERQQAQANGYYQNGRSGYPVQGQPGGQQVVVPAGVVLPVRITRWVDSHDAQPGSQFTAIVNNDILAGGLIAIPRGAEVQGTVVDAKGAGVLKGRGELVLQLNTLDLGGRQTPLLSDTFQVNGHDKTARSVNSTIIGGAIGALIGAAAGGGTGAAIGAGVGGAAGLGTSAASRSGNVDIPAEALLQFRLTAPLPVVTVSEAEMQRLGNFAGPQGARRPAPPPPGYYGAPGPYGRPYGY